MPEVCIMDKPLQAALGIEPFDIAFIAEESGFDVPIDVQSYFRSTELSVERCNNIISKSGESLGDYDFFFEWFKKPTMDELNLLIEKIDEALEPLNVRYSITTK
jgi:hypothetical protein